MEWGEHVRQLEKIAKNGKRVLAIENRPELYSDLIQVWQAFNQLHSGRQSGFGANPLCTTDIVSLMSLYGIDDTGFYELILAMDNEWCKWASVMVSSTLTIAKEAIPAIVALPE